MRYSRPNTTAVVQGHCELCRDGHPFVSPPRAEPPLPATPGTPDAAAVAFSHGLTARRLVVVVVVVGGVWLFQGCACGEYISMGEYDGTRGLLCWFVCFGND